MGDSLYTKFIKEEVIDIQKVLLLYGINGLLSGFEDWLLRNGYLVIET